MPRSHGFVQPPPVGLGVGSAATVPPFDVATAINERGFFYVEGHAQSPRLPRRYLALDYERDEESARECAEHFGVRPAYEAEQRRWVVRLRDPHLATVVESLEGLDDDARAGWDIACSRRALIREARRRVRKATRSQG